MISSPRRVRAQRLTQKRAELLESLSAEARQFGTATVFLHTAMADRLGLCESDHRCADLLLQEGPMTPGELAERTGLNTSSISGVVDRLEAAGFVSREKDPTDGRRVIVQHVRDAPLERRVNRVFGGLERTMNALVASYEDDEIAVVLRFMSRAKAAMQEETDRLRDGG
jgi:DNA-binding MarR family transcriptional regulator